MAHPQLDSVIGRVSEILFRNEVPFRRLDRRVAQQQLDLLQFAARRPAQFGAGPPQVMRRNSRHAGSLRVLLRSCQTTFSLSAP